MRDRVSPISIKNMDESFISSFKIPISGFSREATTCNIGLKGSFGFIDFFSDMVETIFNVLFS